MSRDSFLATIYAAFLLLIVAFILAAMNLPALARSQACKFTNDGRTICSSWRGGHQTRPPMPHVRRVRHIDANGNAAIVRARSGATARVAPSAYRRLQCVVDYVEARGVRIKYMRGYGRGTVSASLHPSGRALDINQFARGRTRPAIPHSVSNAAADHCGVISGARWANDDNGHWNLPSSHNLSARRRR